MHAGQRHEEATWRALRRRPHISQKLRSLLELMVRHAEHSHVEDSDFVSKTLPCSELPDATDATFPDWGLDNAFCAEVEALLDMTALGVLA